jgi:hypothetical protein
MKYSGPGQDPPDVAAGAVVAAWVEAAAVGVVVGLADVLLAAAGVGVAVAAVVLDADLELAVLEVVGVAVGVALAAEVAVGVEVVLVEVAAFPAAALRLATVSFLASTPTPPAPTVASAASPAVTPATLRRPLSRMLMSGLSKREATDPASLSSKFWQARCQVAVAVFGDGCAGGDERVRE